MTMTFLTGGARSGKSARAVLLARQRGGPVTFVATAQARDEEMADRIRLHQAERPSGWSTLEAPLDLLCAVQSLGTGEVGILDCLSLWVNNLLEHGDASIEDSAATVARACADSAAHWFVVTNEVGLGLVPMHPLGRDYRDRLGRVNSIFSSQAETALLMVAGRTLTLGSHNDSLTSPEEK